MRAEPCGSALFCRRTPFHGLRRSASGAGYALRTSRGNRLRPDHQEFADGVKLAAIAAVAAVLTATIVIGAGGMLLPRAGAVEDQPELVRVSLR